MKIIYEVTMPIMTKHLFVKIITNCTIYVGKINYLSLKNGYLVFIE